MTATTPSLPGVDQLDALASRYVDVESLPWKPTPSPGIDMKVLLQDHETGLLTALFRWQPNTYLDLHEHIEIEQSYVLEGSIRDAEGTASAGQFVWRPQGNIHEVWSDEGCLLIAFFLKPNRFLAGPAAGENLE